MTNNSEKRRIGDCREVERLKLIANSWMFSVPVRGYLDYNISKKINEELYQFVEGLGCFLKECGSGTGPRQEKIIAFTIKIEKDVDDNVEKIQQFIKHNVLPIV